MRKTLGPATQDKSDLVSLRYLNKTIPRGGVGAQHVINIGVS